MQTVETLQSDLPTNEAFRRLLADHVARAAQEQGSYAVIACIPQRFRGEDVGDLTRIGAESVRRLVRSQDVAGRVLDEALIVGLPDTDAAGARVLAFRLKSELGLRTSRLRSTKWLAGFACMPENGTTAGELLEAALESAENGDQASFF
jgi:GGDEF domain-containing protein